MFALIIAALRLPQSLRHDPLRVALCSFIWCFLLISVYVALSIGIYFLAVSWYDSDPESPTKVSAWIVVALSFPMAVACEAISASWFCSMQHKDIHPAGAVPTETATGAATSTTPLDSTFGLPSYESAVCTSLDDYKPPSYEVAASNSNIDCFVVQINK
jgi:hypothetical protein